MKIKKCMYINCENKYYAKGYCWKHYTFLNKYGLNPSPSNYEYIKKKSNIKKSIKLKKLKFENVEEEDKYIELKILEKDKEKIVKKIWKTYKKIEKGEDKDTSEKELMRLSAELMIKSDELDAYLDKKKQTKL